jgi:Methyltransferase domain
MTSSVEIQVMPGTHRHDVVSLLQGTNNIGVELGVAEGVFSERMMASGRFAKFMGVDMYADSHDVAQYKRTLKRLGLWSNYKLLRMRFDEAFDLFDDDSLDFVYVDGYAHGGEEGGETIFEWFKKVKIGGVIAGDDYDPAWPLVVKAVDAFAQQLGQPLLVTAITEADNPYCRYPTWAIRKQASVALSAPEDLIRAGKLANAKVLRQQEGGIVKRGLRAVLPEPMIEKIKRVRKALR